MLGAQKIEIELQEDSGGGYRAQPAVAGDSVKPGVERSGTPGLMVQRLMAARGASDSVDSDFWAVARYRGLV